MFVHRLKMYLKLFMVMGMSSIIAFVIHINFIPAVFNMVYDSNIIIALKALLIFIEGTIYISL